MSLNRRNPRRDLNERRIVAALEKAGAMIYRLSAPGLPDLLVGHRKRWLLLEVKGPRGKLEPLQHQFHLTAACLGLPCHVVSTEEQALEILK